MPMIKPPKPKRVRPAGVGAQASGGASLNSSPNYVAAARALTSAQLKRQKPYAAKTMANAMEMVVAGNDLVKRVKKSPKSGDWGEGLSGPDRLRSRPQ